MTTHATVLVKDEAGQPLVNIYQHYDGYPSGLGEQLTKFLTGRRVTNGVAAASLTSDVYTANYSNGMGELAAQLVRYLKGDSPAGGVYLAPATDEDEWHYTVRLVDGALTVEVAHWGEPKDRLDLTPAS